MKIYLANTNEEYMEGHYEYMIKQNKYATHNHDAIKQLEKGDLLLLSKKQIGVIAVGFVEKTFQEICKFSLANRIAKLVTESNAEKVALEQFVLVKWIWSISLKGNPNCVGSFKANDIKQEGKNFTFPGALFNATGTVDCQKLLEKIGKRVVEN